ncbi:MAG: CDP-glycerol glycerophosphotransferase family protein [Methanobacteriaceae archaeon]
MKKLGYLIFAFFFYIFRSLPVNKDKVFLIMTHDESDEGNVGASYKYFKEYNKNLQFNILTKEDYNFSKNKDSIKKAISFFIKTPYNIARSQNILMDNVFLAFAYLNFKKSVNVVQLWHGSGTIKKFGLDSEEGIIKDLATKSNKKNTHLIIESEAMKNEYKSAFGMDDSKIFTMGCPRTDMFFDSNLVQNKIANFYNQYSELKNKKIILYAPTFRDIMGNEAINTNTNINNKANNNNNIADDSSRGSKSNNSHVKDSNADTKDTKDDVNKDNNNIFDNLNISKILDNLDEDYVIALRLHPTIAKDFNFDNINHNNRVYNFTDFKGINTLLLISDILISDYSSIIFEYSLLNKDMIFFPYDFKDFENNGRGFYRDYMTLVPGSVLKDTEELILELKYIINYNESDSISKYYINTNDFINGYNNSNSSNIDKSSNNPANTNNNNDHNNNNNNSNSNNRTNNTNDNCKNVLNTNNNNPNNNSNNKKSISYNHTRIAWFKKEFMAKSDGNASKRLFELLYK